jgi:hypothetical protein
MSISMPPHTAALVPGPSTEGCAEPCVLLLAGDCPQAGIAAAAGSARMDGNILIYSAGSAIRSLIPSHRKLLSKAMVVNVAETSGQ